MQIGVLPSVFAEKVYKQKEAAQVTLPCPKDEDEDNGDELCKLENFRAAVEAYQHKILKGLFALTDEEVQERIELFYATFVPPPDAIESQKAMFEQKFDAFKKNLELLQEKTEGERLLTSSAEGDGDDENGYARSLLPSNPLLQMALQGGTHD